MRKGFRVPPQKSGQAKRSQAASPQSALQQTAYAFRSQRKFPEAKPLLQQLYESDPGNIVYALDFGEACMETEDFSAASGIYAKIIEQDPKHVIALNNLGGALIRCGRVDDARSMLEYSLELDPQNLHARINLGGILQSAGDLKGNLDNALKAVAIDPTYSLAFNNLGSAFSDMAMFNEAKHAFETALMLDSKQVDALINLGGIESRLGNPASAAEKYEQVVKLLPASARQRADAVKFYASFEYLKQGILEKGWDYYEGGFSPLVPAKGARSPNRKFSVPRWNGEALNGKSLLVWREQGLGDELLFATCLHELAALGGQIIVECDARLVETFTRSFPDYRVRAEAFLPQAGNASPNNDFDLHVPMGSLMKYFRRDKQSFTRSGAYVVTHSAYVEDFRQRLAPFQANTRLVGICWRSGKLDPVRNLSYTAIDEWAPLLQMPGYTFVNLQYGECEAELQAIEQKLNIKILRWPDLNLKNDLDRVFALMHCLDSVVSVQTAVLTMAGSVGVPVVGVKAGGWTALGQQRKSLWFDSISIQRGISECVRALPDAATEKPIRALIHRFGEQLVAETRLDDSPSSLDTCYTALVPRAAEDAEAYLILAQRLLNKGALPPDAVPRLLDFCVGVDISGRPKSLRLRGIAYKLLLNGYQEAAVKLSTLLTRTGHSLNPAEKKDLAVIVASAGDLNQAKELVAQAYKTHSDTQNGYSEIAELLIDQSDWDTAIELLENDLQQDRVSEPHHVHSLVYAYGLKNKPESAAKAIMKFRSGPAGRTLLSPFFSLAVALWHASGFEEFSLDIARLDCEIGTTNLDENFHRAFAYRAGGDVEASEAAQQGSSYRGIGLYYLTWLDICQKKPKVFDHYQRHAQNADSHYLRSYPLFLACDGSPYKDEIQSLYAKDRLLVKNLFRMAKVIQSERERLLLGVKFNEEEMDPDEPFGRIRVSWQTNFFDHNRQGLKGRDSKMR